MRYNNSNIDRENANTNRETHLAVTSQHPNDNHATIPLDNSLRTAREAETIPLIPDKRTAIEVQDRIGWDHFIRGRATN